MIDKFKKGCKRLFVGNILYLVFYVVMIFVALSVLFITDETTVTIVGFAALAAAIGIIVAEVVLIIGTLNIRNKNKTLHNAFVCYCLVFIISLVSGFIKTGNPTLATWLTVAGDVLSLVSNILIIKGIAEAEPNCKGLSRIIFLVYIIAAGLSVISATVILFIPTVTTIITIAPSILSIVGFVALLKLFKTASL